jgi:hypothetical protein
MGWLHRLGAPDRLGIEHAGRPGRGPRGALPTGYQGVPHKMYEYGSGRLDFHFWLTPAGYTPGAGDRISIGGPAIGGFVNSAHRLRRLLRSKAAKYDLQGKPFAIIVGVADPMCDLDDVLDALTGTPAIVVATGESTRDETGVYGPQRLGGHGIRRPTLSAVFAVQEWFPAGPYRPRITRFDNPFAAAPFPADALPFGGHWGGRQKPDTRAGGLVGPPGRTDPSTGRLTSCLAADDCWPSPPDGYGNGALANSARDQA